MFLSFLKSSVLVAGDVMLDRYWCGFTKRVSDESSASIVSVCDIEDRPGGAANVAVNIATLGGKVKLIGLVGVDEPAHVLKSQFLKLKVDWDFISVCTHPTIVKLRVMYCNQQLIRLDFEKKFNDTDAVRLIRYVKLYLKEYKVLVLSDYQKGSLGRVEEIIAIARFDKKPVIVDPKGTRFSRYKGATLLTPNMLEFESVVGFCCTEKILARRVQEVLIDYNLEALLLTRSEQGMTLFRKNMEPLYFSDRSKIVCDVTGAGDTVVGVLSAALSSGESLEKSCFLANLAAGIAVGKFKTSSVSRDEMNSAMKDYEYSQIRFGILDEVTLKKNVSLVRSRGEKIVLTNGVFDVLHYGHVSYLTDAKKLGDRLIVAVNSDESTRSLKGRGRPLNTLDKRMFILAALSMVDWVVPFYEDTPIRLIREISPDFLVKGGDYQICDIVGHQEVLNVGGRVSVLNFKDGNSSSKIIDFIKKECK